MQKLFILPKRRILSCTQKKTKLIFNVIYIFYNLKLMNNITIENQIILKNLKYKMLKLIVRYSEDNEQSLEIL